MRSYQVLAVVGGIIGLIIVLSVYAIFGTLSTFVENLSGNDVEGKEVVVTHVIISSILYISVMSLPFVLKENPKIVGYLLFGFAFVTLVSASFFGIISSALFVAGGIAAVGWGKKSKENSSVEILKERYAKGEITKEEFDKMKEDLS